MEKESVQKFDLEAAFKALNEVEIPVVKGIRPNRENLQEKFTRKLTTDLLVEDYFDVSDTEELEQASEEREGEIAKAKLARIEKIVDLNAETEEDLLPSYVGKLIMQCPQCMTLFYKNEEDIEKSEENPDVVNINEPCQHCGNSSGYSLIGKVDTVGEDEAAQYDVEDFDENELNLDFDEEDSVEEEEVEEPTEDVATEEEEAEVDLEPIEDTEEEEVKESLTEATITISRAEMAKLDKEVEDAQKEVAKYNIPLKAQKNSAGETENVPDFDAVPEAQREAAKKAYDKYQKALKARPDRAKNVIKYTDESLTEEIDTATKDRLTKEIEEIDEKIAYYENQMKLARDKADVEDFNRKIDGFYKLRNQKLQLINNGNLKMADLEVEEALTAESLTEDIDKDLDAKLKAHNDYIEYLKNMIKQEEESLKKAENEFVKKAIQRRLDAFKADLEEALPEELKTEVEANNDLPTPEEVDMEAAAENTDNEEKKEKKESLTEGLRTWTCWFDDKEIGTVEAETEEEAYEKMEATWPELPYGKYDGVAEVLPVEDLNEETSDSKCNDVIEAETSNCVENDKTLAEDAGVLSTTIDPTAQSIPGASRLKRKLSATELIVKKLVAHPLFKGLSTRTVQRILLPYYIEQMGRDNLSFEAMVEFFEFEGFAPYVLDNFMTMDPLARKELLKADAKFMEIFNAYAKEYDLFPTSTVDLEPGENEFDYVFNVVFDIDTDGNILDTEATRSSLKSFAQMYAAGKFDKSLVVESLTEDVEDNLDVLFNSEEFKKPITEKEVEAIKAKYEGLEEEVAPGIESEIAMKHIVDTWESIEDLDDATFNKLTESYLTEVYSNVKSFEATNCDLKDNKLVIEGTITFNSGKNKPTTFVYEAKETADKKVVLEGLNADFATEKAFTLNCNLSKANCLIVESLGYKYTINDTLVEGLVK